MFQWLVGIRQTSRPPKALAPEICFLMSGLYDGGATSSGLRVLRYFHEQKIPFRLFILKKHEKRMSELPVEYKVSFGNSSKRIRTIFLLPLVVIKMLFFSYRCRTFVSLNEGSSSYLTVLCKIIYRKPAIAWIHSNILDDFSDYPFWHGFVYKMFYQKLDRIMTVSAGLAERFIENGFVPKKVVLQTVPIDFDKIQELSKEVILDKCQRGNEKVILTVGRAVYQKNLDLLLRALKELLVKGVKVKLWIIGDGILLEDLKKLAKELEITDSVTFFGYVANPYPYFLSADLFVLPSRHEAFGMAIVEALGLNLPIVASDCDFGPREILKNGCYGRLFETDNSRSLIDAIEEELVAKKSKSPIDKGEQNKHLEPYEIKRSLQSFHENIRPFL